MKPSRTSRNLRTTAESPGRPTCWNGQAAEPASCCKPPTRVSAPFRLIAGLLVLGPLCWQNIHAPYRLLAAESGTLPASLPKPGGATEPPTATSETIPLANPGFEEQWDGWTPRSPEGLSMETQPGAARSGQTCLRFDCGCKTKYTPSLHQKFSRIEPGVYVLRFWLKLEGVSSEARQTSGVRVSIEYLLKGGQRAWPSTTVFHGTADWQEQELKVYIPTEANPETAAISVHRYGSATSGAAWFDNFSLTHLRPPAVEAFLLYPNFRGYLAAGEPAAVRLWVRRDPAQTQAAIRIEVRQEGTQEAVASKLLEAGAGDQIVELDSSAWPLGSYVVEVRSGEFSAAPIAIRKISFEDKQRFVAWFDANQVLHLHGRPAFPIGLYNTTRQFTNRDEEFDLVGETARLEKMAEAPVSANINYWFWMPSMEVRGKYLDAMNRAGIGYLDTVNNVWPGFPVTPCVAELLPEAAGRKQLDTQEEVDLYLTRLAGKMRVQPAMLGWYVMDERSFADVPKHFHRYRVLAEADPDHPAFGVSNEPHELAFWRDALDVIGMDPYPVMNMNAGRPLTLVGDWTRAARRATLNSRPVWMVIQFFQGWSTDRWPTEEELRTMSLMAITEGARGLFYWSYGSKGLMWVKDPQQQAEYWRRLVSVTRELRTLEPALLAADAPERVASVSDPRVRWVARIAGGKCTVFAYLPAERFVADPSAAERTEVRFTLADGQVVMRTFRPDFADWFSVAWSRAPSR